MIAEKKPKSLFLYVEFKSQKITLLLDFMIRIFFIYLLFEKYINGWACFFLQVGLMIVEGFLRSNVLNKHRGEIRTLINEDIKDQFPDIEIEAEIWDPAHLIYSAVFFVIFVFYVSHSIGAQSWYDYVGVGAILSVPAIVISTIPLLADFPLLFRPSDYRVLKRGEEKAEDVTMNYPKLLNWDLSSFIDADDYNDSQIARMESSLKNITSKVDSYMLESVLLGALAFSGFLTILSSDLGILDGKTLGTLSLALNNMFSNAEQSKVFYISKDILLLLIMLLSLLCSVFFILVLSLRLRFGGLALKMDYFVRIINIFNSKEEELNMIAIDKEMPDVRIEKRIDVLKKKINAALTDSSMLLKEIKPVIRLMSLYRNLGMIFFYLILIVSGLYFSRVVSFIILLTAIFTVFFRFIDSRLNFRKINRILGRY